MDARVGDIMAAAARLRQQRLVTLSQAEIVAEISRWAERWRNPDDPFRQAASALTEPFPFAMTQISLDALLDSLTSDNLWALIDAESVRDKHGCALIGHVIAGNTPLLAWTSILRALLMRSASLVKLPSGAASAWGHLFWGSLPPSLASCVALLQWPRRESDANAALCQSVDLLMAYGDNETIQQLRALTPAQTPFLGYGHRVSFGLVPRGVISDADMIGFATDVLLYDQGGCLSPQTIFVEGAQSDAVAFAGCLAGALSQAAVWFPLPVRAPRAAAVVQETRALARMEPGARLWEDPALRWTVIARPNTQFVLLPTYGIVSVQPLVSLDCLPDALAPVASHLQGCALAGIEDRALPPYFEGLRISRICLPGQLQAPPLSWPQDGRAVLRCLFSDA